MGSSKKRAADRKTKPGVLIYHPMTIEENFERCAFRLLEMIKSSQKNNPGSPRTLYFDVDGHRNASGAFDRDAWEIIHYFIPEVLFSYLTRIATPLYEAKNRKGQRDDIPKFLTISGPKDEDLSYDVSTLELREREESEKGRTSPPSVNVIARFIGVSPPKCLICFDTPVERAHAVPKSLGGSYDVQNFALLCVKHHKQAPDISDAEGFWAWIDYMVMRKSGDADYSSDHPRMLGVRIPRSAEPISGSADFGTELQRELIELYGWDDEDFSSVNWLVNMELHKVLDNATGYHFGLIRKPSTYAWAYDVALRRAGHSRAPYYPIY